MKIEIKQYHSTSRYQVTVKFRGNTPALVAWPPYSTRRAAILGALRLRKRLHGLGWKNNPIRLKRKCPIHFGKARF